MKWSNCGILLVGVILLCFGQLIKRSDTPVPRSHQQCLDSDTLVPRSHQQWLDSDTPVPPSHQQWLDSDKPVPRCHNPDILYSYLEDSIIRYNRSYPYVDPTAVLSPVLELMLGTGDSAYSETNQDLMTFWLTVCQAKDLEQEIEAWKILAREIIHRMQTDQSVYQISTLLFGDRMGRLLVSSRLEKLGLVRIDHESLDICVNELALRHTNHCGPLFSYGLKYLSTFDAMCIFGLKGDEYASAAQEVCKNYVFISHPLRELS